MFLRILYIFLPTRLLLFICFFLSGIVSEAQFTGEYQTIFHDNNYKLEVSFHGDSSACVPGNQPISYKYRIKGNYTGTDEFVTWSIRIIDCDGKYKRKYFADPLRKLRNQGIEFSPDYIFTCFSIASEVETNLVRFGNNPVRSLEEIKIEKSVPPNSISGPNEILKGKSVTLSVSGGLLADEAKWAWYKDTCLGNPIAYGKTISVTDKNAGLYLVRAEKPGQVSPAVSKLVVFNRQQNAPDGIFGITEVCPGSTTRLTVVGGLPNNRTKWAWHQGLCNGRLLKESNDNFVDITVNKPEIIFVKAVGSGGNCVSLKLKTLGLSTAPTQLQGKTEVCEGEMLNLEVVGNLSRGQVWELFDGNCGTGEPIQVIFDNRFSIMATEGEHSFFALGKNNCGTSACVPFKVKVNKASRLPYGIDIPVSILKDEPFNASVHGGFLNPGSTWVWYFGDSESNKTKIGTGASISYKTKVPGKIFVGMEGNGCGENSRFISVGVSPTGQHGWDNTFNNQLGRPKIKHIGFSFGFDWSRFVDLGTTSLKPSRVYVGNKLVKADGPGFKLGFDYHPLYTKYGSFGVLANGVLGFSTGDSSNRLFYNSLSLAFEGTVGTNGIKFYGKVQEGLDYYNIFSKSSDNTQVTRAEGRYMKSLEYAIGLRIGGSHRRDKKPLAGRALDLYYLLADRSTGAIPIIIDYTAIHSGVGFGYWIGSGCKVNYEFISGPVQSAVLRPNLSFNNATMKLSLVVALDWFY